MADSPPARDAARLRNDQDYRVLVNDLSGQYWVMVANTTAGPTANKKIRQALNYAIDRKRFIDTSLAGVGEPTNLPWLPNSPAYEAAKNTRYAFDLDKAKALVAESGESDVSFDFVFNAVVPEIVTFAQLYQADLAKIGVKLNIKGVERSVYNDMAAKFQYGLLMSSSGFANLDPGDVGTGQPLLGPEQQPGGHERQRAVQAAGRRRVHRSGRGQAEDVAEQPERRHPG